MISCPRFSQYPERLRQALQQRHRGRIVDILTSTRGPELLALKQSIDIGAHAHSHTQPHRHTIDLHRLVFDLLPQSDRQLVLSHFRQFALAPGALWHVLSDVDDTLLPFQERRGRGRRLYPGVSQLIAELTTPTNAAGTPYITLLTARPRVAGSTAARRALFSSSCLPANVLYGDPSHILPLVWRKLVRLRPETWNDYRQIARRKFHQTLHYCLLYPEYKMLFMGDTGQGDLLAALAMRTDPVVSQQVRACVIHDSVHLFDRRARLHHRRTSTSPSRITRESLRQQNIFVCENYVQAAQDLAAAGILSPHATARVLNAASAFA